MDKAQGMHSFWSGFEWPAIEEQSSYDERTYEDMGSPQQYITYELVTGNLGDPLDLTGSLWDHSTSWAAVSQKAEEIAAYIGYGGRIIRIDDGYLWIKLVNPFTKRMEPEEGYDWRRLVLNISVDFLTAT